MSNSLIVSMKSLGTCLLNLVASCLIVFAGYLLIACLLFSDFPVFHKIIKAP